MGIINASLADVSTEFVPVEPGIYEFEIQEVTHDEKDGRTTVKIKSAITDEGEMQGRTITDRASLHKKDGSVNQFGLIQVKRYMEAVIGKEELAERLASGDQPDTQELKGGRFRGEVKIRSYKDEASGEDRQSNEFKAILPL